MRHSNSGKKFSRTPSHRKALLRNLAKAFLSHGKIRTTEIKAKALRGVVEPLITLALKNDLHARRRAYRVLGSHSLVKRLFDEIAPAFAGIPGGYTRVVKLADPRKGDAAPMAVIELTRGPGAQEQDAAAVLKTAKTAAKAPKIPAADAPADEIKPKRSRKKTEAAVEAPAAVQADAPAETQAEAVVEASAEAAAVQTDAPEKPQA